MSASVMMPVGWPVRASRTIRAGGAGVLHQIGGRLDVVALFYRRQRWPHYVCGGGRGGGVGLLGHLFYLYLSTFTFRWGPELGAGRGQECSPCPGFRLHVIRRPRRPSGQGWPDLGLGRQYRSGLRRTTRRCQRRRALPPGAAPGTRPAARPHNHHQPSAPASRSAGPRHVPSPRPAPAASTRAAASSIASGIPSSRACVTTHPRGGAAPHHTKSASFRIGLGGPGLVPGITLRETKAAL